VPKPNPGKPGDDKNKHGNNEAISSDPKQSYDAAHAYGHGSVRILIWKQSAFINYQIIWVHPLPPGGMPPAP